MTTTGDVGLDMVDPQGGDPVDTIVVIPCYNEEHRLDVDAFVRFSREEERVRLLFVDDGSTDATAAVLGDVHDRAGQRVSVLTLPRNSGKAEAVRRGVLAALDRSPLVTGYWDADLSTSLDEIPVMRELLLEDPRRLAVIGARVRLLGRRIERSGFRHYAGRAFATAASLRLGLPVYDTQCGAKLFRGGGEATAAFGRRFSSRWIFDVEILARLTRSVGRESVRDRIVEHPLAAWTHVGGSKLRVTDMLRACLELMRLRTDADPGPSSS